uniref:Uncharacterized protein n=1 Tax=Aplanochytrium stocchinoi TaxID=215587 RepID=A0A6S8BG03_9STRA
MEYGAPGNGISSGCCIPLKQAMVFKNWDCALALVLDKHFNERNTVCLDEFVLFAARNGPADCKLVFELCAHGADSNAVDSNGTSVLGQLLFKRNLPSQAFRLWKCFGASISKCSKDHNKRGRAKLILALEQKKQFDKEGTTKKSKLPFLNFDDCFEESMRVSADGVDIDVNLVNAKIPPILEQAANFVKNRLAMNIHQVASVTAGAKGNNTGKHRNNSSNQRKNNKRCHGHNHGHHLDHSCEEHHDDLSGYRDVFDYYNEVQVRSLDIDDESYPNLLYEDAKQAAALAYQFFDEEIHDPMLSLNLNINVDKCGRNHSHGHRHCRNGNNDSEFGSDDDLDDLSDGELDEHDAEESIGRAHAEMLMDEYNLRRCVFSSDLSSQVIAERKKRADDLAKQLLMEEEEAEKLKNEKASKKKNKKKKLKAKRQMQKAEEEALRKEREDEEIRRKNQILEEKRKQKLLKKRKEKEEKEVSAKLRHEKVGKGQEPTSKSKGENEETDKKLTTNAKMQRKKEEKERESQLRSKEEKEKADILNSEAVLKAVELPENTPAKKKKKKKKKNASASAIQAQAVPEARELPDNVVKSPTQTEAELVRNSREGAIALNDSLCRMIAARGCDGIVLTDVEYEQLLVGFASGEERTIILDSASRFENGIRGIVERHPDLMYFDPNVNMLLKTQSINAHQIQSPQVETPINGNGTSPMPEKKTKLKQGGSRLSVFQFLHHGSEGETATEQSNVNIHPGSMSMEPQHHQMYNEVNLICQQLQTEHSSDININNYFSSETPNPVQAQTQEPLNGGFASTLFTPSSSPSTVWGSGNVDQMMSSDVPMERVSPPPGLEPRINNFQPSSSETNNDGYFGELNQTHLQQPMDPFVSNIFSPATSSLLEPNANVHTGNSTWQWK